MPLKKSDGNMYPWVTHTHSHLGGECPHGCSYCYVQAMAKRFPNMRARYSGPVRIVEKELSVNYGEGKTIFIEHMNDLFATGIPAETSARIWEHIEEYPNNSFVFQSKDLIHPFLGDRIRDCDMVGTTIETNRWNNEFMGRAPEPLDRKKIMQEWELVRPNVKRFVTIEPILDFDVAELAFMIFEIQPDFVNIGADSKGTGLPEPSGEKVRDLIEKLTMSGIEIKQKRNLERLFS